MDGQNSGTRGASGTAFTLTLGALVFLCYAPVGMTLGAVPVVVLGWHLNNFWAGLAVGLPFAATIVTRGWAGSISGRVGSKACLQGGLAGYIIAGGLGWCASLTNGLEAYGWLLSSRVVLGVAESFAMVGVLPWALHRAAPGHAGFVLSVIGLAVYAGMGLGGPLGMELQHQRGWASLAVASALIPLLVSVFVVFLPSEAPTGKSATSYRRVFGQIFVPGAGVLLQGVGFAALGAFFPAAVLQRGWTGAGLGLAAFGLGFVFVRLVGGRWPDRWGGWPVAAVSLAVETVGLALVAWSPVVEVALGGALVTGLGCSLVFPSLGLQALRFVSPSDRALATAGFTVYQDLAYGLTGPLLGFAADAWGYPAVFLGAGIATFVGFLTLVRASRQPASPA